MHFTLLSMNFYRCCIRDSKGKIENIAEFHTILKTEVNEIKRKKHKVQQTFKLNYKTNCVVL